MKRIMMLALVVFSCCVIAAEYTKDSAEAIKAKVLMGKIVLVDVREKDEWDEGHVEGAKFLPLSKLNKGASKEEIELVFGKDKTIYLHCKSGVRCMKAAEILEKQGFKVQAVKLPVTELISTLGKAK